MANYLYDRGFIRAVDPNSNHYYAYDGVVGNAPAPYGIDIFRGVRYPDQGTGVTITFVDTSACTVANAYFTNNGMTPSISDTHKPLSGLTYRWPDFDEAGYFPPMDSTVWEPGQLLTIYRIVNQEIEVLQRVYWDMESESSQLYTFVKKVNSSNYEVSARYIHRISTSSSSGHYHITNTITTPYMTNGYYTYQFTLGSTNSGDTLSAFSGGTNTLSQVKGSTTEAIFDDGYVGDQYIGISPVIDQETIVVPTSVDRPNAQNWSRPRIYMYGQINNPGDSSEDVAGALLGATNLKYLRDGQIVIFEAASDSVPVGTNDHCTLDMGGIAPSLILSPSGILDTIVWQGDAYLKTYEADITDTYYYTLDGSVPTTASTSSIGSFDGVFDLENGTTAITINALMPYNGENVYATSDISFVPSVATPTIYFDIYGNCTIETTTTGTTIYYTTDGSYPTTASTVYNGSVLIISKTTVKAIAALTADTRKQSLMASATYDSYIDKPVISPDSGRYDDPVTVSISASNVNHEIYYTLDKSIPTKSSTRYTSAFTINETTTVMARAFNGTMGSDVASQTYKYTDWSDYTEDLETPNAFLNNFNGSTTGTTTPVILNYPTAKVNWPLNGATPKQNYQLYVTLDGTNPTLDNYWQVYTTPCIYYNWGGKDYDDTTQAGMFSNNKLPDPTNADKSYVMKFRWVDHTQLKYSPVATLNFVYKLDSPTLATSQLGTPDSPSSSVTCTITRAHNLGAVYAKSVSGETASVPTSADTYVGTHDNLMQYTWTEYNGYNTISFIRVSDWAIDSEPSSVKSYFIAPATITITPPSTNYPDDDEKTIEVSIASTSGSTIYYTTDGSVPTSASTEYTEPFEVTATSGQIATVRAYQVSTINDKDYNVYAQTVYTCYKRPSTPVITPDTGTYEKMVICTIEAEDPECTLYYTTDGTEPTSASTKYVNPLAIPVTTTVKAMAYSTKYRIYESGIAEKTYTISIPQKSSKARRASDNSNGIYVKDVTYSGISANLRSAYVLPSAITVTDTEADVTWGYHVDNVDENLGEYGTKCHVNDTSITVHVEFTHGGKKYVLEKDIPCTCVVQDAIDSTDSIDIIEANAIVTLENQLRVKIKARVKHIEEQTVSIVTNIDRYTLSGTSSNGNFLCEKDGGYFTYDDVLVLNYSGSTHPANDIELTLVGSNGQELDHHVITVTFAAGSIFEVRDDAIRMAVQSSVTYTDGEISGVTNHISQLEINISGITGTVSAITNTVSGISADVSQLQQTASSLTSTVTNISGDMVTHSELAQTASSITAQVVDEVGSITGMFISAGTITLDASKTIITGELKVDDGIAFFDGDGNLGTTINGDDIGNYKDQKNGSEYWVYASKYELNQIGYSYETDKEIVGDFVAGDVISISTLSEWCTITPNGGESGKGTWDTASAHTVQVQFYLNDDSTPFYTNTVYPTGSPNSVIRTLTGNPIFEVTMQNPGKVYVKYAVISQASSQVGTRDMHVSSKFASDAANATKIGKHGISISHQGNYISYIGTNDFVLRKGQRGIRYGEMNDMSGTTVLQTMIGNCQIYGTSEAKLPEHPDNLSDRVRGTWIPIYNYTPSTSINSCATYWYGTPKYYSGDRICLKLSRDKIVGDVKMDYFWNETTLLNGERVSVLLPPVFDQITIGNNLCNRPLPEGYTVRIHNTGFYSGFYILANFSDEQGTWSDDVRFYTPNGTGERQLYFGTRFTYVELVYGGVQTIELNSTQIWYVRNCNQL